MKGTLIGKPATLGEALAAQTAATVRIGVVKSTYDGYVDVSPVSSNLVFRHVPLSGTATVDDQVLIQTLGNKRTAIGRGGSVAVGSSNTGDGSAGGTSTSIAVATWSTLLGKPSTFPPSPHTHHWADVIDHPGLGLGLYLDSNDDFALRLPIVDADLAGEPPGVVWILRTQIGVDSVMYGLPWVMGVVPVYSYQLRIQTPSGPQSVSGGSLTLSEAAQSVLTLSRGEMGLRTQAAHTALLGPLNGAPVAPTFRTLQVSDLPLSEIDARYLPIAGGTLTGGLNMGNHTITNLVNPSNDQDAATKGYVDSTSHNPVTLSTGGVLSIYDQEISFHTASPNQVFAGPASGSYDAPYFRPLVADDIPAVDHSKVSDFDTQVRTSRLDQMALATTDLDINTHKLINLSNPVNGQDAATKYYVDSHSGGTGGGGGGSQVTIFTIDGPLNRALGICPFKMFNLWDADRNISKILLSVYSAPTGSPIVIDIRQNGVTLFTNPAHKPVIAAGGTLGVATLIDVYTWAVDSYLEIFVDQCGSGAPGNGLVVEIVHA